MEILEFKDLRIGFTTQFALQWNDKGSGGKRDGAYWRPVAIGNLNGYHPLGDYGVGNYNDVNGQAAVAVVSDVNGPSGNALRPPLDYELVWTDKGSGSDRDGSMWRPLPPPGYVALGLVCNNGYGKPAVDIIRCVRADLVIASLIGNLVWDDSGTGADRDFGSWEISPPGAPAGEVYLSPGTYVGVASHTKPNIDPNAYGLRLQIPLTRFDPPPTPVLHGYSKPTGFEQSTVTFISNLSWFMVNDPNLQPAAQLVKSPVYRLERTDKYTLIGFGYNETSADQSFVWSVTNGVNGSSSKSFTSTTGIEIGGEWTLGPIFKASAKLNQSFSYTTTSSSGWDHSTTRTVNVVVPVKKAVAAFAIESTYKLFRADGTQVSTNVSYSDGDNIYWTQYPPSEKFNLKVNIE